MGIVHADMKKKACFMRSCVTKTQAASPAERVSPQCVNINPDTRVSYECNVD